jgi:hypothetical protein
MGCTADGMEIATQDINHIGRKMLRDFSGRE